MPFPGFLKRDGDALLFNGDGEMIYYIPEAYFSNKTAVVIGEYVETLGIFNYSVFDKNGKSSGLKTFNFPATFRCKPTTIEKFAEFQLKGALEPEPYRLLHFSKGYEAVCSTKVQKKVLSAETYLKLYKGAKLPETAVPYEKLQDYLMENANLSGFDYDISAQILGLTSELCRDPKDLTKPYRLTDMKGPYKFINILQLPKYVSAYTAITSQNADESIANAMLNKSNKESPLEKVMMD